MENRYTTGFSLKRYKFWKFEDVFLPIVPKLFDPDAELSQEEIKLLGDYMKSFIHYCSVMATYQPDEMVMLFHEIDKISKKDEILEVTFKLLDFNIDPW